MGLRMKSIFGLVAILKYIKFFFERQLQKNPFLRSVVTVYQQNPSKIPSKKFPF